MHLFDSSQDCNINCSWWYQLNLNGWNIHIQCVLDTDPLPQPPLHRPFQQNANEVVKPTQGRGGEWLFTYSAVGGAPQSRAMLEPEFDYFSGPWIPVFGDFQDFCAASVMQILSWPPFTNTAKNVLIQWTSWLNNCSLMQPKMSGMEWICSPPLLPPCVAGD